MAMAAIDTPLEQGFFHGVKARGRAVLRALQTGQMIRAMHMMTDEQLAEIGVKRSQIPAYAARITG